MKENFKKIFTYPLYWEMTNAEKLALLKLMEDIKPAVAIEIGTKKGGSLQLISEYSGKVYALDIDRVVEAELADSFPNVEYIIGDSRITLPALLTKLYNEGITPEFILIDGDHSTEGVMSDIESVLKAKYLKPVTVLMHDSFNPLCREGMLKASYHLNKQIELIELDFIHGTYSPSVGTKAEMWGGFGLLIINPEKTIGDVTISQSSNFSYSQSYFVSKHRNSNRHGLNNKIRSILFNRFFTIK